MSELERIDILRWIIRLDHGCSANRGGSTNRRLPICHALSDHIHVLKGQIGRLPVHLARRCARRSRWWRIVLTMMLHCACRCYKWRFGRRRSTRNLRHLRDLRRTMMHIFWLFSSLYALFFHSFFLLQIEFSFHATNLNIIYTLLYYIYIYIKAAGVSN